VRHVRARRRSRGARRCASVRTDSPKRSPITSVGAAMSVPGVLPHCAYAVLVDEPRRMRKTVTRMEAPLGSAGSRIEPAATRKGLLHSRLTARNRLAPRCLPPRKAASFPFEEASRSNGRREPAHLSGACAAKSRTDPPRSIRTARTSTDRGSSPRAIRRAPSPRSCPAAGRGRAFRPRRPRTRRT